MSIILRKGIEVALHQAQQKRFDKRRREVDRAWALYRGEVFNRIESKDESPAKYGFEELSRQTEAYVMRESQRWARSCRKYRLYEDDFESYFRLKVVRAALKYNGDGTFFDYLRAVIQNSGRDLVRHALTRKNRINHLALSLDNVIVAREVEKKRWARSAEDEAITRMIIEDMASDTTLTEQERGLFDFLREDPDATLQEMADALRLRDRKQASRVRERLANKLRKYIREVA